MMTRRERLMKTLKGEAVDRRHHSFPRQGLSGFQASVLCALCVLCAPWAEPQSAPHASIARAGQTEHLLAAGTKWQTPYYVIDSNKPGPTVMIVGGVHGNERAGAGAAEEIRHWPIVRGKLLVVPRASVPALLANKRCDPNDPSEAGNLNRNFPCKGGLDEPRGVAAQAIWQLAARTRPDWLVDLHEGINFRKIDANSTGGSIIRTNSDEVRRVSQIMLDAVNATIDDQKQKHVLLMGPAKGSLARAAWERLQAKAMILETCRKDRLDVRIRQHRLMIHALLTDMKMIDQPAPEPPATMGSQPVKAGKR